MNEKLENIRAEDLENAGHKQDYNRRLFDVVAPAYSKVTRVLSFGQDNRWKQSLVQLLPQISAPVCLDLACGPGDLCRLLSNRYPGAVVIGVDQNREMLRAGADSNAGQRGFCVQQGDMQAVAVADQSVDIITGGYAIRNAPDLQIVITEVHRVLKPGGVAAFLDFSKSPGAVRQRLELGLLRFWGGLWGWIFHRNPGVYSYIAKSLDKYPDRVELKRLFKKNGFETVACQTRFTGLLELLVVRRND